MDPEKRLRFLRELAKTGPKANMWQVGQALGLDRQTVETLSLDLLSAGLLEMVSLSGAVSLTESGLAQMEEAPAPDQPLDLPELITAIEEAGDMGLPASAAADLALDLASLKPQLKRSQPLKAILIACLESIHAALNQAGDPKARELAQKALVLLDQKRAG